MTIIKNNESIPHNYKQNPIKQTIMLNEPIEEKLNVIAVLSNPCLFKKRYKLMNEFINRIKNEEQYINLYIVELAYEGQQFMITSSTNKNHLQLRTSTPLWHKENMINLGVKYLLPKNWKAFAWIDSDLEFESPTWSLDTLKILNGYADVVQLFSHCIDLDHDDTTMNIFSSFCHQYTKNTTYSSNRGANYWHPGYAWACTRKAYEKMGGLLEHGILGSGDYNMASCFVGRGDKSFTARTNEEFKKEVLEFQIRVKNFRICYVPGVIRHYFHGSKINRKYSERWQILAKYNYNPKKHITYDDVGIIIPSDECPKEFINEIYNYFLERNEDE
jgi:hypothetical protein